MATNSALIQFSNREIELLKKTIAPGTNNDQLALFVQVCSQLGLNPFARQIYAVIRSEKQKDGSYEKKMAIQTSIDGYRLLAQRSNEYAGQEGPYWYDEETKEWVDVWLKDTPPAAAKVGVMRKGFAKPIYAVARYATYVARDKNGNINHYTLWSKMPEVMIAKVAEALALRRAFPAELSGIYTSEEMEQADGHVSTVETTPVPTSRELYRLGAERGMWTSVSEYFVFVSNLLQIEATKDTKLTSDQRTLVKAEIEQTEVVEAERSEEQQAS